MFRNCLQLKNPVGLQTTGHKIPYELMNYFLVLTLFRKNISQIRSLPQVMGKITNL